MNTHNVNKAIFYRNFKPGELLKIVHNKNKLTTITNITKCHFWLLMFMLAKIVYQLEKQKHTTF